MIIKIKFSAQLPATKSYIRFPITDSQENKDTNVNFFLNLYVPYISNFVILSNMRDFVGKINKIKALCKIILVSRYMGLS